jgi:hypothetical protein
LNIVSKNIKKKPKSIKSSLSSNQKLNEIHQNYENKLEQKNWAIEFYKTKIELLENNLENNKLFLNMVVHDMRNPTSQIEYLL